MGRHNKGVPEKWVAPAAMEQRGGQRTPPSLASPAAPPPAAPPAAVPATTASASSAAAGASPAPIYLPLGVTAAQKEKICDNLHGERAGPAGGILGRFGLAGLPGAAGLPEPILSLFVVSLCFGWVGHFVRRSWPADLSWFGLMLARFVRCREYMGLQHGGVQEERR